MEKQTPARSAAYALLLCAIVFIAAACTLLYPARALAADVVAYAYDDAGNSTPCYSYDEAIQTGYSSKEICLAENWLSDDEFKIASGKTLVIDMNGYKIEHGKGGACVFSVGSDASLTLMSSNTTTFQYRGLNPKNCARVTSYITTGGLVTGGYTYGAKTRGSAVDMASGSSLTLDHVALADNVSEYTGTVAANADCKISMKDASIIHNDSGYGSGGGIAVLGNDVVISMDNSKINENFVYRYGGGVYASGDATIYMKNHSEINGNCAERGGGVYAGGNLTIISEDKTGSISNNDSSHRSEHGYLEDEDSSGGGVYMNGRNAVFKGLTISGNLITTDGGGLELKQTGTATLEDCTISNNECNGEGAGARVKSSRCTFKNCVVTGNVCNKANKNYEGGGIFVGCNYNITLSGICIIKGNTRGVNGSADDLFLSESKGGSIQAYIVGGVERGSKIGVRTGIDGGRQIGKDLSSNCYGAFFMDLDDYYVVYQYDDHGNMWQDKRKLEFAAWVNGAGGTRYKEGTYVTVDGTSTDPSKAFWHWDTDNTLGLYPISDYINDTNMYWSKITYKMPQNDTQLFAVYADRVTKATLNFDGPVTGGAALPTTAVLKRTDGGNSAVDEVTVPVTWYEVKADGSRVTVSGCAKYGTEYVASFTADEDQQNGLFFSSDIEFESMRAGSNTASAASTSIDSTTGALTVVTTGFKTEGDAPADDTDSKVTVNIEDAGPMGLGGESGKSTQDADGSFSPVEVYYAAGSDYVTITAPKVDGLNFCNWDGVKDGWINDDVEGVITIPAEDLTDGLEVTAVYTPVIVSIELGLSTPKAGEKLSTKATSLIAVGSDGVAVDLVKALGKKKLNVEWAPGDKSAAYSTTYAATVKLASAKGLEDPEGALKQDATVTLADGTQSTCANFAVFEGKLCLLLLAPETGGVKAVKGLSAKKAGKKAVKLTWKKSKATRDGVQVRYSAKKDMKGAKKALAKGASVKAKILKKLKSGKRYYFQVRAYKVVNGKRYYSSWSDKASVKVK